MKWSTQLTAIGVLTGPILWTAAPVSPASRTDGAAGGGSGMALLYSDHIPLTASGEPMVAIGLMQGKDAVTAVASAATQIEFFDHGIHKRTALQAGQSVRIEVLRSAPAKRKFYVRLAAFPFSARQKTAAALAKWRDRGLGEATALQVGTVLGIGGRVLDNREVWVVLPARHTAHAKQLAADLHRRFSTRASVQNRLESVPWAELRLSIDGRPVAAATSFVRIVGEGPVTIRSVEYGRGYRWHGHEDRNYTAEVYVVVDPAGRLAVVNVAGAETILAGVVPAELFASAPGEALRAQSVAARNHLLSKLGQRHHGEPFHLCSEQHCQVFAGNNKRDPRTDAAVTSTRGKALFKDGSLVHSTYSSTCGGHTENNDTAWDEGPSPALRGRPDFDRSIASSEQMSRYGDGLHGASMVYWLQDRQTTYCSLASSVRPAKFRWHRTFDAISLAAIVRKDPAIRRVGQLKDITVDGRGPGGKVTAITLHGTGGKHTLRRELPIRRLFDNLNSGAFVIERQRGDDRSLRAIVFRGGGWGHGVGMCQMGAIGRAEHGHSYLRILKHYYNDAELVQLY